MLLPNLLHTAICYKWLQTLSSAKLGGIQVYRAANSKVRHFQCFSDMYGDACISGYLVVAGIVANIFAHAVGNSDLK